MRILFVGNSYTFCNDLPATLVALAAARGHAWRTGRYLQGGGSLKTHVLDNAGVAEDRGEFGRQLEPERVGGLSRLLAEGRWDVAVLQGQSMDTVATPLDFMLYGRQLAALLRAARVPRIVLYQTWARQHLPEQQATITAGYAGLAAAIDAEVAPVGEAWRRAFATRPGLVMHVEDRSHPNDAGSYLAACVLFRQLTGGDTTGLPFAFPQITQADGRPCYALDAGMAAFLQAVAGPSGESTPRIAVGASLPKHAFTP